MFIHILRVSIIFVVINPNDKQRDLHFSKQRQTITNRRYLSNNTKICIARTFANHITTIYGATQ